MNPSIYVHFGSQMIFRFSPSDIEGGETVYCSFQGGFSRRGGDSLEMISIAAKDPNKLAYGKVNYLQLKKLPNSSLKMHQICLK